MQINNRAPRAWKVIKKHFQKTFKDTMDTETAEILAQEAETAIKEGLKKYGILTFAGSFTVWVLFYKPRVYFNRKTKEWTWTQPSYKAIARISRQLNRELLENGIEKPLQFVPKPRKKKKGERSDNNVKRTNDNNSSG